jgi:geranylgeranyl diphosphate synthase type II
MRIAARIEGALQRVMDRCAGPEAPPLLAGAMRHAVFPGGARVRPQLCLSVALACGDRAPEASTAAACAIELLHCASLVHDDLPCFDDADMRRGRQSVHSAYGEPIAVLAGDALIVAAFEALAEAARAPAASARLGPLVCAIAAAAGAPHGIVAGQAWESEPRVNLRRYHAEKTGALFVAATRCGAIAAGADPDTWHVLGARLGEAYQVADDLMDAVASRADKPVRQDAAHDRPNVVAKLGVGGAVRRLEALIGEAVKAVPECEGSKDLRALVRAQASRLAPKGLEAGEGARA